MSVPDSASWFSTGDSHRVALPAPALEILRNRRPNVLLIGALEFTESMLTLMQPYLREPIVSWCPRDNPDVPCHPCATLVVRDVKCLDDRQQSRLLSWLDEAHGAQVISTSATAVYPRVERDRFSDALYYRLNHLCFERDAD